MTDDDAAAILTQLSTCTLPKPEWTHEAHVAACWATLRRMEPDEALDALRSAIRSYNVSTGVANTATSGYHETITRYYVGALASLGACSAEGAIADARCTRTAPLAHWSNELLFSEAARARWVAPDLAPLSWETPGPT